MIRYPHTLYFSENATDSTQSLKGNWVPTLAPFSVSGDCREEPNGSGRTIILEDGKAYQFSSVIYLSSLPENIKSGVTIRVVDQNGNVRLEGKVARVSKDRKNCRIWV